MNNITHDHTPFAQARVLTIANMHACILNLTCVQSTCMHVHVTYSCRSSRMSLSILQPNCQPAETQPSATVA